MPRIDPTPEQTAAIEAFRTGGDLVLEAGAGTGKTSTLKLLADNAEERGLYLAYNKAIQVDAKGKFPPHCQPFTAHSLAFRAIGKDYVGRLDSERMPLRKVAEYLGINRTYSEDTPTGPKRLSASTLARLAIEMVERFCQSADTAIGLHHRPYVEGLVDHNKLARFLLPFAQDAWQDLVKPDGKGGRLRFNHDYYLKLWQLTNPSLPCEFVLFDEAQDANPCIAAIVAAHTGQRVYVGDRAQSIYGWRGAVDAMDIDGVPKLYLSKSFRFGQAIADEANRWLEMLETPLRLTGNEAIVSTVDAFGPEGERVADGEARAVLCRSNATAFETLITAMARGTKAHLMGGGREILAFCKGVDELRSNGYSSHRDLIAFKTWGEVQEYVEEDKRANDLKVLVDLVDRYNTTRLAQAMRDMYPDEETAALTVSTAHKAKGREWDSVRIAGDFAPYTDESGVEKELSREDIMLRYVAVTRAQYALDRGPLAPNAPREEQ